MNRDAKKLQKLWEQAQEQQHIIDINGLFYIESVDRTGAVKATGKINAENRKNPKWVEPLAVVETEEIHSRGTKKTKELLNALKPGAEAYNFLIAMIQLQVRLGSIGYEDEPPKVFVLNCRPDGILEEVDFKTANAQELIMKIANANKTS